MTSRTTSQPARPARNARIPRAVSLVGTLCSLAGVAHAQSAAAPASAPKESTALTWHGITLYGIVDVGLQYDTHAAPFSDYFMAGSSDIVQKNSRQGIFGVTSNNLSQSRIGLNGSESLGIGDWSGVFKLETFFNPASGQISDALKSLTQNNGRALHDQNTNLDSSVGGQAFQQSFAGLSSPTYGTITFGRQNTVLADGVAKYDPNAASQAFSLVGLSGTAAGGGDTQDRRLDSSLKYGLKYQAFRFGAQYKFSNAGNSGNSAYQFSLGGDYAGFSADAYYSKVKSAIALSALSAGQVTSLPALGFSPSNSLAATISDNTTYSLMAMYSLKPLPLKFYAAYENITYRNPETALGCYRVDAATGLCTGGFDVAAYKIAFANNAAYNEEKVLSVYWAGAKYSVNSNLDLTAAYYAYHQSSYATGKNAGCTTIASGACRGQLDVVSLDAVYKLSKRFDSYAGLMWSGVKDGSANGYIYSKNNINPTIGVRFTF